MEKGREKGTYYFNYWELQGKNTLFIIYNPLKGGYHIGAKRGGKVNWFLSATLGRRKPHGHSKKNHVSSTHISIGRGKRDGNQQLYWAEKKK